MSVALIDGDVLAYLSVPSLYDKKISDDFVITDLDEKGKVIHPDYTRGEIKDIIEVSWSYFKINLQDIITDTYCESYKMAVKGEGNFREDLFPDYKNHRRRQPNLMQPIVNVLRERAIAEGLAVPADGREADDLLRIWATPMPTDAYIVCSIDKDLFMIPGSHYNLKHKTFKEMSVLEARRSLYQQILAGDPVDAIQGIPKVGPVKSKKALESCESHEEFQEVVVAMYFEYYGEEEWLEQLQLNGSLIYLQTALTDYFDAKKWRLVKELL
jgi:hypothetical protein